MTRFHPALFLSLLAIACGDSDPGDPDASSMDAPGADVASRVDALGIDAEGVDAAGSDGGTTGSDAAIDVSVPPTELKAFPSAFGAGARTTGGRGGQVIHVTNLNDSGAGSLRDALSQTYPRIIVFDVSGEINNLSSLSAGSGNFTIAGHTAPEGGITITGERVYIAYTDNWIIRYVRFRNGKRNVYERDCITAPQCSDVVVDHCSFAFASDEGLDFDSSEADGNVTVQNNLFYENKTGMLLGGDPDDVYADGNGEFSVLRNVFSHVSHRFPNVSGTTKVDVINNFVHNWRYRTVNIAARIAAENPQVNVIENYYQSGGNTVFSAGSTGQGIFKIGTGDGASSPLVWSRNNHVDQDLIDVYLNEAAEHAAAGRPQENFYIESYTPNGDESVLYSPFSIAATFPIIPSMFSDTQLPLQGVAPTILSNTQLATELFPTAGASQYLNADGTVGFYRDPNDTEAIALARKDGSQTRTSSVYSLERPTLYDENLQQEALAALPATPQNSRPEGYDTDRDGMPNVWEAAMGFDPDVDDGSEDHDDDGYTNLEEFLNMIDR